MFRNIKDLRGYGIRATDGTVGEVDDFYFDDEDWAIRYLVVHTGNWLAGRHVLISPLAVGHPDWTCQLLPVALTRSQIEHSPDIDTRKPVSRQQEAEYLNYYAYPNYWGGGGLWGMGAYPGSLTTADRIDAVVVRGSTVVAPTPDESHLRSCTSVIGHHVHATDGDLGHVEDFLVDEATWAIRYLVVNTSHWWGGHRVLIAPQWIESLNWPEARVDVGLTRQSIKDAPAYDSAAQLDRQREQSIFEHHGRPNYWTTTDIRHDAALSST